MIWLCRGCVCWRGECCVEPVLKLCLRRLCKRALYERGCVGTLEAVSDMLGLPWGRDCDLDK